MHFSVLVIWANTDRSGSTRLPTLRTAEGMVERLIRDKYLAVTLVDMTAETDRILDFY